MLHTPVDARESLTAVILSGGRARRMGGCDKGLIEVAGRPAIEYAIDAVHREVNAVLISANRNAARYRSYGFPVIADSEGGFAGPLAGVLGALQAASTDYVLTLPCDAPLLEADFVHSMTRALATGTTRACVARDGQRMQPLFALLHRSLAHQLALFLESGERRAQSWMESLYPTIADLSCHGEWFFNMNTPADRARLEQQLAAA